MVRQRKTARNVYDPLKDVLTPQAAFVQSCVLLDMAAIKAINTDDPVMMVSVAQGWTELGMSMAAYTAKMEEEESSDLSAETQVIGFGNEAYREEAEDAARKSKS